jgi:hypothetical protein
MLLFRLPCLHILRHNVFALKNRSTVGERLWLISLLNSTSQAVVSIVWMYAMPSRKSLGKGYVGQTSIRLVCELIQIDTHMSEKKIA